MFHGLDRIAVRRLLSNVRYLAKVEISCSRILHARLSQFFVEKADNMPSASRCRLQPKIMEKGCAENSKEATFKKAAGRNVGKDFGEADVESEVQFRSWWIRLSI
jgi:hypothetical protein